MSKKMLLLVSALVALLASTILYLVFAVEWEKVEQEVGLSEVAQQDPLLAATTFLATKNIKLSTLNVLADVMIGHQITLANNSSIIVDEAALIEYKGLEKALLTWVKNGGHLVYLLSPRHNSLTESALLSQASIEVIPAKEGVGRYHIFSKPTANVEYTLNNETVKWRIPYQFYFKQCAGNEVSLKKTSRVVLCDLAFEHGFITFIPSLHPISNSGLKHLDHGEFLLWLVGKNQHVWYIPSLQSENWLASLWHWSGLFLVLLTISILALMWHVSMRLGLAKTPLASEKNKFADHIEAIGNFMIKQQHHEHLKQALVHDIEQVMELRNPRFKQLPPAEQAQLLSQVTGKNQQVIEQLLTEALPTEDNARLQFVKTFKELRKAL